MPVIEALVAAGVQAQISVDTSKAEVTERALAAGATLVNDVTALRAAPEMAELTAAAGADLCLMHMISTPRTMQPTPRATTTSSPRSSASSRSAWRLPSRTASAEEKIILDPGFGAAFGKTVAQNLELLRRLPELVALGRPMLVGTSRKCVPRQAHRPRA